ncbi:universal stress protein [Streptacidiphilus sp. PB12-B1b]|uniref:universal stress protein n=1 Tax=Streptacidiphilus sp. PB12-B1b TaxID=2705012 RepID=UPI0015FD7FE2|nr:universal stress protein [Streptacidiphilus sp. PB12-B1b]QMU76891.1 universal stress protein [Streptacidiphilus sp. PB12-B1b]
MSVLVWITEGTWQAAVDAARTHTPTSADITLLYVTGDDIAATAHGSFAALLGRSHRERDPGTRVEALEEAAAAALLAAAAERLNHPGVTCRHRHGRVEREVVREADTADLLICVRDGDRNRLGPRSLGHATRFVVDHAPCAVLLVWPEPAPGIDSLPPAPPEPPPHQP